LESSAVHESSHVSRGVSSIQTFTFDWHIQHLTQYISCWSTKQDGGRSACDVDVLCFLMNKFGRTPLKQLKTIMTDFYCVQTVVDAKLRLLEDIKGMNLSTKLPHVPLRRSSDGRLGHEIDDILTMFIFLDENNVIDRLPIGLCSVLCPRQHSIGYMGDGFYRLKDPTNSIKVLKEERIAELCH